MRCQWVGVWLLALSAVGYCLGDVALPISPRERSMNSIDQLLDKLTAKLLVEETQFHDRILENKQKADMAFKKKVHQEEVLTPLYKLQDAAKRVMASKTDDVARWAKEVEESSAIIKLTEARHKKEKETLVRNAQLVKEISALIKSFKSYGGKETDAAKSTLSDISTRFSELSSTQPDLLQTDMFLQNKFDQIALIERLLQMFTTLDKQNELGMADEIKSLQIEHRNNTNGLALAKSELTNAQQEERKAAGAVMSAQADHSAAVAFYLRINQEYQQCQTDFGETKDTITRERKTIGLVQKMILQWRLHFAGEDDDHTAPSENRTQNAPAAGSSHRVPDEIHAWIQNRTTTAPTTQAEGRAAERAAAESDLQLALQAAQSAF